MAREFDTASLTAGVDRAASRVGPTALRWTAALLWLANVGWKVPPDFGRGADSCRALCRYVALGADHPVIPGSDWVFAELVSPNLAAFGWVTLVAEATLATLLIAGRYVRVAALLGVAQSVGIGLAVANAPDEWYWSYLLMVALHVAVLVTHPAERPPSARVTAVVAGTYGVVVAVANAGAGFNGGGDQTLFDQDNDLPGDWGRGTFPGSVAVGLILVGLAVVVWFLDANRSDRNAGVRRLVGWTLVVVPAALLLTYRPDGLAIGLDAKPATLCVVAALGLALAVPATRGRGVEPGGEVAVSPAV